MAHNSQNWPHSAFKIPGCGKPAAIQKRASRKLARLVSRSRHRLSQLPGARGILRWTDWGSITAGDISSYVRSKTVDDFVAVEAHEFNRIQRVLRSAHKRFNVNHIQATKSHGIHRLWNLVRDQGIGGSNPLSPTNSFKHISSTSGFPSTLMVCFLP